MQKVKIQKLQAQKIERAMLLSKCAVCDIKKSEFFKQEDAKGLLSSLGTKITLNEIPLLGPLLF